jgi:hypothetical protein
MFSACNTTGRTVGGSNNATGSSSSGTTGASASPTGTTTSLVAHPVIGWFRELAIAAGGELIGDRIADWLSGGSVAAQAGERAAEIMSNSPLRFSDLSQSPVYFFRDSNIYSYGAVSLVNSINACAPMIIMGDSISMPMIEGPGIVGLALLSGDVTRAQPANSGQAIQRTMLPSGSINSNGWDFRFEHDGFAEYPTTDGSMRIDYRHTQPNRGEIQVNARDFRGGRLAEGVYDVDFATV